jgi:lysylphosphatidylglycerol synthetase-like protein (DUF2156 family)
MRSVEQLALGRTVRRRVSLVVALAGVIDVVSAGTAPIRSRAHALHELLPLVVPQTATALVAVAGVVLLLLARALRLGKRRAWLLAIALLAVSALLHLIKGVDVEEAVSVSIAAGYLLRHRRMFPANRAPRRMRQDLPPDRAFDIVRADGGGTLDYFALRSDKNHFIWRDTLIAYAVFGGVCLVSPDPIGPLDQREAAWTAFRHVAECNGWLIAVLGAAEASLPMYRACDMRTLYMGDEAVVDVRSFSLEGGRMKGLRHVVNRMTRHGYRVEFFDPAFAAPRLTAELRHLFEKSRRGECERGFSMTLGRAFAEADRGLLLAVAFDAADRAVAFCQFVPARDIDGYSLDLMRRDRGDHPNGLLDFIILETIRRLREQGRGGLALNFASFRAVVAGEAGDSMGRRLQRWFLLRMSDSMQIESLWRFNEKYSPTWRPRFAVYDSVEHFMPAAVAVARAESFWELPVVGRFLTPA